ncbi:MAG: 16S rRNA (cytidine(1402)-2'-O)-methyltransferase [bacterium]|nr:16S rRNA (cytidine(1402)-2'-O)-methyltransferase [Candidatus Wildermuthbacteria bacterium]MDP2664854.1 16S rRNA (cytidine(1402)-2'-O)-methyltransferase [bacterium]
MGTLFIVATPIGNLEDLTFRALRILKEVSFLLCEDTRVTRKLLDHYGVSVPVLSYHQHTNQKTKEYVLELLSQGKNLALVTDAGTPGIADPGNELIAFLADAAPALRIIPIPGPSALSAIASIAGVAMDRFLFLGYPPHKKGRKKFFEEAMQSLRPVILYESPYRIVKTLSELQAIDHELQTVVSRELTKKFETTYRGTIDQVLEMVQKDKVKGEFVVVIKKQ